jgi:hypothetical protein
MYKLFKGNSVSPIFFQKIRIVLNFYSDSPMIFPLDHHFQSPTVGFLLDSKPRFKLQETQQFLKGSTKEPSIETHGALGIPHFKKPPYNIYIYTLHTYNIIYIYGIVYIYV